MSTIIAGTFDTLPKAQRAIQDLHGQGWGDEDIHVFHNNPPGQHGAFPIGGDEMADPKAKGATRTALKGASLGAGAGGVAGALAGPLGAAVGAGTGAWIGALGGALKGLGSTHEDDPETRRAAGVVVAVHVSPGAPSEEEVERILREDGALAVEKAEGEWRAGEWKDFDPVASPQAPDGDAHEILYRIAPGGRGRWNVFEGGVGKLLSDFSSRDQAINYASALASTKARAVVEIYRAGGELESSRAFSNPYRSPGNGASK